jgi:hypothetical protein
MIAAARQSAEAESESDSLSNTWFHKAIPCAAASEKIRRTPRAPANRVFKR